MVLLAFYLGLTAVGHTYKQLSSSPYLYIGNKSYQNAFSALITSKNITCNNAFKYDIFYPYIN
jgi:hypothetical protein